MHTTRSIIFFSILLLLACNKRAEQPILPPSAEEYSIFAVVIDSVYYSTILGEPPPQLVVITDSTIAETSVDSSMMVRMSGDSRAVYKDRFDFYQKEFPVADWLALKGPFNKINFRRFPLSADSIRLENPFQLLSQDSVRSIFAVNPSHGWMRFQQRYPQSNGFIGFSRVAFNQARSEAVVYYEHCWDGLGAEGAFALLRNQNGRWHLIKRIRTWES